MLWKPHHLIRKRTNFDFLGKRRIALVLSTAINVLSLVAVAIFGLNFGIDFEGGIGSEVLEDVHFVLGGVGRVKVKAPVEGQGEFARADGNPIDPRRKLRQTVRA